MSKYGHRMFTVVCTVFLCCGCSGVNRGSGKRGNEEMGNDSAILLLQSSIDSQCPFVTACTKGIRMQGHCIMVGKLVVQFWQLDSFL